MNKIEIKTHMIPSGYKTKVYFIDGKPIYEYFNEWVNECNFTFERSEYDAVVKSCYE